MSRNPGVFCSLLSFSVSAVTMGDMMIRGMLFARRAALA